MPRKKSARRLMRIRLLIKDMAESRGLSRAQLARRADITYETVFNIWRNAYTDVSISTLVKIARALRCNVNDLFTIENEEE